MSATEAVSDAATGAPPAPPPSLPVEAGAALGYDDNPHDNQHAGADTASSGLNVFAPTTPAATGASTPQAAEKASSMTLLFYSIVQKRNKTRTGWVSRTVGLTTTGSVIQLSDEAVAALKTMSLPTGATPVLPASAIGDSRTLLVMFTPTPRRRPTVKIYDTYMSCDFRIQASNRTLQLRCGDLQMKQQWMTALQECIRLQQIRRASANFASKGDLAGQSVPPSKKKVQSKTAAQDGAAAAAGVGTDKGGASSRQRACTYRDCDQGNSPDHVHDHGNDHEHDVATPLRSGVPAVWRARGAGGAVERESKTPSISDFPPDFPDTSESEILGENGQPSSRAENTGEKSGRRRRHNRTSSRMTKVTTYTNSTPTAVNVGGEGKPRTPNSRVNNGLMAKRHQWAHTATSQRPPSSDNEADAADVIAKTIGWRKSDTAGRMRSAGGAKDYEAPADDEDDGVEEDEYDVDDASNTAHRRSSCPHIEGPNAGCSGASDNEDQHAQRRHGRRAGDKKSKHKSGQDAADEGQHHHRHHHHHHHRQQNNNGDPSLVSDGVPGRVKKSRSPDGPTSTSTSTSAHNQQVDMLLYRRALLSTWLRSFLMLTAVTVGISLAMSLITSRAASAYHHDPSATQHHLATRADIDKSSATSKYTPGKKEEFASTNTFLTFPSDLLIEHGPYASAKSYQYFGTPCPAQTFFGNVRMIKNSPVDMNGNVKDSLNSSKRLDDKTGPFGCVDEIMTKAHAHTQMSRSPSRSSTTTDPTKKAKEKEGTATSSSFTSSYSSSSSTSSEELKKVKGPDYHEAFTQNLFYVQTLSWGLLCVFCVCSIVIGLMDGLHPSGDLLKFTIPIVLIPIVVMPLSARPTITGVTLCNALASFLLSMLLSRTEWAKKMLSQSFPSSSIFGSYASSTPIAAGVAHTQVTRGATPHVVGPAGGRARRHSGNPVTDNAQAAAATLAAAAAAASSSASSPPPHPPSYAVSQSVEHPVEYPSGNVSVDQPRPPIPTRDPLRLSVLSQTSAGSTAPSTGPINPNTPTASIYPGSPTESTLSNAPSLTTSQLRYAKAYGALKPTEPRHIDAEPDGFPRAPTTHAGTTASGQGTAVTTAGGGAARDAHETKDSQSMKGKTTPTTTASKAINAAAATASVSASSATALVERALGHPLKFPKFTVDARGAAFVSQLQTKFFRFMQMSDWTHRPRDWKAEGVYEGIHVESHEFAGQSNIGNSSLLCRGRGIVRVPPTKLMSLLWLTQHKNKYDEMCTSVTTMEHVNNHVKIEEQEYKGYGVATARRMVLLAGWQRVDFRNGNKNMEISDGVPFHEGNPHAWTYDGYAVLHGLVDQYEWQPKALAPSPDYRPPAHPAAAASAAAEAMAGVSNPDAVPAPVTRPVTNPEGYVYGGDGYAMIATSVPDSIYDRPANVPPLQKDLVQAHLEIGGFFIRAIKVPKETKKSSGWGWGSKKPEEKPSEGKEPDWVWGSEVWGLGQIDLGGRLPTWIASQISKKQPLLVGRGEKYIHATTDAQGRTLEETIDVDYLYS